MKFIGDTELIFFISLALQPNEGHGFLMPEVVKSRTTTHRSR